MRGSYLKFTDLLLLVGLFYSNSDTFHPWGYSKGGKTEGRNEGVETRWSYP